MILLLMLILPVKIEDGIIVLNLLASFYQEEVIDAVGVLRNDPLLYLVVVLPLFAVFGMAWLYMSKHKENKELRTENKDLTTGIIDSNKLSTEAITAQVEVMRTMRSDQKDALSRYDQKTDTILTHLTEIKVKMGKND